MKRISGNYKKFAIIMLAFLFAFPSICFAMNENEISTLPMQLNVPCDKVWTVAFNEEVDIKTIVEQNIFVKDSKGCEVDVKLELDEAEKSVRLIPSAKYLVQEKYTIYIKNLIKNKAGNKFLKNDFTMDFTVSSKVTDLPVVGTEAKLRELLDSAYNDNIRYFEKAATSPPVAADSSGEGSYSNTNVQVDGVDEGDSVKTDGENIYRINNQAVEIVKAYPVEEMKILHTIQYKDDINNSEFYPNEIYVDANHLVVIGSYNNRATIQTTKDAGIQEVSNVSKMALPYLWKNTVKVIVYDISDINNIKESRKVEIDGYAVSTRKIGNMLYIVSNENLNYYRENESSITPGYVDSAVGNEYVKIDYNEIHYLKESVQASYLMLTSINLENPKEPANIYSCLGNGGGIYMSKEYLYITAQDNNRYINNTFTDILPDASVDKTNIYKFHIEEGKFEFVAKGQVRGTVLNQFSMDENNEYFRVATTTNPIWNVNGEQTTKNNVYMLDKELKLAGKLEDLAKGERIYSVRFMGNKGYVVTFKNIDPLFVIDLKDVNSPTVLGQLKIPGYSSYLHPYDENHIIGIGKDTVEIDGRALEKGVKLSLFDVTDYTNPTEKFNTVIGDTGSYSEVLNNHKALLFSKEKNLLAFPISVVKTEENSDNKWGYGKEVFQGAYVYNIDLLNGFNLRGELTHLSPQDLNNPNYEHIYDRNVQRILYIDNTLYTVSNDVIMANDFDDLSMKNKIVESK